MKLKYIIYLLSLIFLISCTEGIIKTESITRPVHVYSVDIPESINLGQSINFKMACQTPDPCHEFSHLEIRDTVFEVWIKVYTKRDPKVICICTLGSIEKSGQFRPYFRGSYQFHFWQEYYSKYLDKTVEVK